VSRLSHACGRLFEALAVLAALMLLAMVVLVTTDIALRNLAGMTLTWSNEVSEYALYLMTLLTAPWLLRRGQHVRLDLVLTLVPNRVAWLMEAAADVVGFAVGLVLLRYSCIMVYDAWRLQTITIKNLFFPEWWILLPLPIAVALVALEFVFRFQRLVADRNRRLDATSVG
jgi:TRAP-type C4-dicarboxylate transport system permease small subunit